jgi:F0F1-type ATP synthase membrane subunit b/b'
LILKEAKNKATQIIIQTHKQAQEESLKLEREIADWLKQELKQVEERLTRERQVTQEDLQEAVAQITTTLLTKMKNHQESFTLEDVIEKKVFHD